MTAQTNPGPAKRSSLLQFEVQVKAKIEEVLGQRRGQRINLDDIYSETLTVLNQKRLSSEEAQTLRSWILEVML